MDKVEAALAVQLSENLKELRQSRGYTQAELAERASISPHYVALIETARKLPTLKTVAAFGRALGVSLGRLLEKPAPSTNAWSEQVSQLAESIPDEIRPLVHDFLRAAASHRPHVASPPTKPRRGSNKKPRR
ncbi:MAG: helix-turn-helix transcriptional regulator [Polyangiaceae bacterium]|nr:helix-turn-helix transcriptional regulator [Polyangiaceae bacterium]